MLRSENYLIRMENGLMSFEPKKESPIVISVPHDGFPLHELSGFFDTREIGYRGRDRHSWPIAKDILLGTPVSAVRGLMPRALIDYNRAWPVGINYERDQRAVPHTALDDSRLQPWYETYCITLDRLLIKAIRKFGRENVLLIDLHGFTKQPPYAPENGFDVILGTGNRVTIPYGEIDRKLSKHLTSRRYRVFLPEDKAIGPAEDYYSADFTTRHYSEKYGVNAIQMEIASWFRAEGSLALGQSLSQDIVSFIKNEFWGMAM